MGFPGGTSGKEPDCQCRRHKRSLSSIPGLEDPLEKGTATHSSILAWRIPWTEEPGRLQSMGSQRIGHDWSNLACTHTLPIEILVQKKQKRLGFGESVVFFSSINNLLFITCRYMWKYKVVPHFLGGYILSPRLNNHYYFALYVLKTFCHEISSLKVETIIEWTPMCHWRVSIITNSCQACFTNATSQLSPPSSGSFKSKSQIHFWKQVF